MGECIASSKSSLIHFNSVLFFGINSKNPHFSRWKNVGLLSFLGTPKQEQNRPKESNMGLSEWFGITDDGCLMYLHIFKLSNKCGIKRRIF